MRPSRPCPVLLFGALGALLSGQTDSLEDSARAILSKRCAACHGEARTSDLDVRGLPTLLKGGKRGPAIVPGKAAESLLWKAVKREGELQMPPGKTPLPAAEVEILRNWIDGGAKWETQARAGDAAWW